MEAFQAGGLRNYIDEWAKITTDESILDMVKGLKIDIDPAEHRNAWVQNNHFRNHGMNEEEVAAIDNEITTLLSKGVIAKSEHETGEFISGIFTRRKTDGNYRLILNLKEFNRHTIYKKFKMETLKSALSLITQGCWLASVDLVSAYYSVPIAEEHMKFLKFYWKGQLYHYTCLANGVSQGPRCFTKLTKPIYAILHQLGYISTGYLDDSLLVGKTFEDCLNNITKTVEIFDDLGFVVHPIKSVLTPVQKITYLGVEIDTVDMSLTITTERKSRLIEVCQKVVNNRQNVIRDVAQVVGLLVSSFIAVPHGPLYYRTIEREKIMALRQNGNRWDKMMVLSDAANREIRWWIANTEGSKGKINIPDPDMIIKSDASLQAWGACCNGIKTGGAWSHQETETMHINELELMASFLALKSFARGETPQQHVRVYVDNTVAMSCINKMGSSRSTSLNDITKSMWEWCIKRNIWLSAARIAGKDNVEADYESRHVNEDTEWQLDPEILRDAVDMLKYVPNIDLFASRLNTYCQRYVSHRPDPGAMAIDAFTLNWIKWDFIAFPPFSLVCRVLKKIQQDKATGAVVVPYWPTQTFFPLLMSLLIDYPVLLSSRKHLLRLPSQKDKVHPLHKKLKIMVCLVSGVDMKNRAFQRKLPISSWHRGDQKPKELTLPTLINGKGTLIKDRWIRFHHL